MNKSAVKEKVAKKDPEFAKVSPGQGGPHGRPRGTHAQVAANFPRPGPQDCTVNSVIGSAYMNASGVIYGNAADILDIQVSLVVSTLTTGQMRVEPGGTANITIDPVTGSGTWAYQFAEFTFPRSDDKNCPATLVVRARTRQGGTITLYVPFSHVTP
jgi:hypothetical protein